MVALPIGAINFSLERCELEPRVGGGNPLILSYHRPSSGRPERAGEWMNVPAWAPVCQGQGGVVDSHPSLVEPLVYHEASQANCIIELNN